MQEQKAKLEKKRKNLITQKIYVQTQPVVKISA